MPPAAPTQSRPNTRASCSRTRLHALDVQAGLGAARMAASKSTMATTKVDKRAEQPPQALRDEFKFMIPQDGKTLKDRVADYVKDGELTKGDEVTLMNWLDNYKEAMAKAPESTGDDKKFAIDEYFELLVELVHKERKRPHYFNDAEKPTGQSYEDKNFCHPDSKFFDYQKFGIDFTRPLVDWCTLSEGLGARIER